MKAKKFDNEAALDRQDARDAKARVVTMAQGTGLDFNALRVANVARSESKKGFNHPMKRWSVAEWTNALAGEAGEASNIAKKLIRIRYKTRGNKNKDNGEAKLLRRLAREIADVVIYADLVLASEGINLSAEVVKVWNRKAKEIGYDFKLREGGL